MIRIAAVPVRTRGGLLNAMISTIPRTDPGITYGDISKKSRTDVIFDLRRTIKYDANIPSIIMKTMAIVEYRNVRIILAESLNHTLL
jgi:hypothetical protein